MDTSFRQWLEAQNIAEGAVNEMIRRQIMKAVHEYVQSVAEKPAIAMLNHVEQRLIPMLALRDEATRKKMINLAREYRFNPDDSRDVVLTKTAEMLQGLMALAEDRFGDDAIEKMRQELSDGIKELTAEPDQRGMPPSILQRKARFAGA